MPRDEFAGPADAASDFEDNVVRCNADVFQEKLSSRLAASLDFRFVIGRGHTLEGLRFRFRNRSPTLFVIAAHFLEEASCQAETGRGSLLARLEPRACR